MDNITYQKAARRTSPEYDNIKDKLRHAIFGLTSEAGEAAGILQKEYQGHQIDQVHMMKELGDCLWMISEACDALDTTIDELMDINIAKLINRYPDGFSADRSLHREAGDV